MAGDVTAAVADLAVEGLEGHVAAVFRLADSRLPTVAGVALEVIVRAPKDSM